MKLLLLALAYWFTIFLFSYKAYWLAILVCVYLYRRLSTKYVILYGGLAVYAFLHFALPSIEVPDSFAGKVTSVKKNYVVVELDDQKIMLSNVDAGLHDTITFTGKYESISGFENSGLFDYHRFRSHQHIYFQLYAESFEITKPGNSIQAKLYRAVNGQDNDAFRQIARRFLFQIQEQEEYEFASTVLSSGMHLTVIVGWFERVLSLCITEVFTPYLTLLLPLSYGIAFGWNLSLIRIIAARLLALTKLNRYHRLAVLMIVLLLMDPHNAFSLAFVIPMTLRIALLFRHHKVPLFIYRTAVLFPILLHTNFRFTLFQAIFLHWFRNVFAILHLLCLLALVSPMLQLPLIGFYDLILTFMENQHLLFSFGITMKVPLLFCTLWIALLCYGMNCWKRSLIGLSSLLAIQVGFTYFRPWTEVTFLDVGQGDSTLITLPFHSGSILIDTGGHVSLDIAKMVIVPYLRKKGISSLDLVILTHDDIDHRGAFESLRKQLSVKQLIDQKQKSNEYGVSKHQIGNQTFQLLLQDVQYDNDNDNSLIVYLPFDKQSILFMGDAGMEVERKLIKRYEKLEATILHVGHHGSNTSTGKDFLKQVNPLLAVISSGKNNRYRHPHPDVVERLMNQRIRVIDTQEVGSITLYISRFHTFVRTYTSRFAIIEAVIS